MHDFLHIAILGSGSDGNAIVVSNGERALMIDAGFSCREIMSRLARLTPAPPLPAAALLTHDHTDHVRGCRVFCDRLGIPAAASCRTAEYLRARNQLPRKYSAFRPGTRFDMAGFAVATFPVPHDAMDPVGFVVSCGGISVGIATDLGEIDDTAETSLHDCDALVLESNYDPCLLRDSGRPLRVKRRIAGRRGHLENAALCDALPHLLAPRTKLLMLIHVSRECNDPELVRSMVRGKLDEMGRSDVILSVAGQDDPAGPFKIERAP